MCSGERADRIWWCSDLRAEDKPHDSGLGAQGKGGLLSTTENPGDEDGAMRTAAPSGRPRDTQVEKFSRRLTSVGHS